ncbi:MAG: type II toxin-antitoxin system VapB family antitoxin [Alphaproteobacteria bacterium]|nr:type II toxin-antitoxin system VapB family antitoxin [Alphaproteobacteria bacterium]
MPLSIRNAKVEKLARQRAAEHNMSVTAVIGQALQNMAPPTRKGLAAKLRQIATELQLSSPGGGRLLTKDEINAEWMD